MDRVTAYAENVVSGAEPANELVRLQYRQHLADLERSASDPEFHAYWDAKAASAIAEYAERYCNVFDFVAQKRVPFKMIDWQAACLGMVFGWKIRPDTRHDLERLPHTRRYRHAVILTGRGSGKSPLGIVVAQYLMLREPLFSGVCLASVDSQAWRPFTLMREMMGAEIDPEEFIDQAFTVHGAQTAQGGVMRFAPDAPDKFPWLAGYQGVFRSTSELARAEKRVGGIPSFVLVEEYQAHASSATLNAFKTGFKQHLEPLCLYCMNAPPSRVGPAWEMLEAHRNALKKGVLRDDTLHFEYAIDDGALNDAIKKDRRGFYSSAARIQWKKANPSIDVTVRPDFFAGQLADLSDKNTQDRNDAIRELFSVTPDHVSGELWFEYSYWDAIQVRRRPSWVDVGSGAKLYLGLDIGLTQAFTALACCWISDTSDAYIEVRMYTHGKDLVQRGAACGLDLAKMARERVFIATPGEYCDLRYVVRDIIDLQSKYPTEGMAVDRFRVAQEFARAAADEGLRWDWVKAPELLKMHGYQRLRTVAHPQGGSTEPDMSMRLAMERVEKRVVRIDPTLTVLRNPLLEAMFGFTEMFVRKGQGPLATRPRWLRVEETSEKSGKRFCDGIIAATMAIGIADYAPADADRRGSFDKVLEYHARHVGLRGATDS